MPTELDEDQEVDDPVTTPPVMRFDGGGQFRRCNRIQPFHIDVKAEVPRAKLSITRNCSAVGLATSADPSSPPDCQVSLMCARSQVESMTIRRHPATAEPYQSHSRLGA